MIDLQLDFLWRAAALHEIQAWTLRAMSVVKTGLSLTVTLRTCRWIDDCVLKIQDWNQWELLMVTASIPPQVYCSIFLCFLNTILIVAIAKDDSTWPADKDGDQRTLNCLLFSIAAKIGVLCFLSCHNQRGQDLLLSWARRSNCGIAIHLLGRSWQTGYDSITQDKLQSEIKDEERQL